MSEQMNEFSEGRLGWLRELTRGSGHIDFELARELLDEIYRLRAQLLEDRERCACGCDIADHENYGEDGEGCDNPAHECLRTSTAIVAMLTALRARMDLLTEQNAVLEESARWCASCGQLMPTHSEDCGRWPLVLEQLTKERDDLRAEIELLRAYLDAVGFDKEDLDRWIKYAHAASEWRALRASEKET